MNVIRETKRVKENPLIINVPNEFLNRKVEIIILPVMERKKKVNKKSSFLQFVKENRFKLPEGYKFVREELYER